MTKFEFINDQTGKVDYVIKIQGDSSGRYRIVKEVFCDGDPFSPKKGFFYLFSNTRNPDYESFYMKEAFKDGYSKPKIFKTIEEAEIEINKIIESLCNLGIYGKWEDCDC